MPENVQLENLPLRGCRPGKQSPRREKSRLLSMVQRGNLLLRGCSVGFRVGTRPRRLLRVRRRRRTRTAAARVTVGGAAVSPSDRGALARQITQRNPLSVRLLLPRRHGHAQSPLVARIAVLFVDRFLHGRVPCHRKDSPAPPARGTPAGS